MLSAVDPQSPPRAAIFGLAGETLSAAEAAFFRDADPLGFILFGRNCRDPQQLRTLTDSLRACVGRAAPILIDQEGGRVRRLRPPHWSDIPSARHFGKAIAADREDGLAQLEQAMTIMAGELAAAGITVDCAPVLDILCAETHDAIGDRAYGDDPVLVAEAAERVCEIFLRHGVIPVAKHIPGQGRATLDSHHDLPIITAGRDALDYLDFAPFKALASGRFADGLWGMVAHVIYQAIDPDLPATCSPEVIATIRNQIGFDGLLLTDDLVMKALDRFGAMGARAATALQAGCDIALHCNGNMAEMEDVASRVPRMSLPAVARYNRSVLALSPVLA